MIPLAAALRYWREVAIAACLLLAAILHMGKLRAERSLEKARGELRVADLMIERQNAAVRALEREARERTAAGRQALAEARRLNQRQVSQIEGLRRSAARPRGEGPCTISDALRTAEGL